MPLIICPDCSRQISDLAPSCPGCGRPTQAPPTARIAAPRSAVPEEEPVLWPPPPEDGIARRRAPGVLIASGLALVGVFGGLAYNTCSGPTQPRHPVAEHPVAAAVAEEPTRPPEDPTKAALIRMDGMPVSGAFAIARSIMGDSRDNPSAGALLFALWGARRMKWADVFVPQDETTFAMVQKDSSEQIGMRMCSAGEIIEIHATKPDSGGHLANGILMSDAGHLYEYLAVGSSGSLGQGSRANLCGFVTGNYDYSNSGGGVGHAVSIVGMFDLPENAKPGR